MAGKPGSPLADAAQFHLGALQYDAGRYEQAIESFSAFEGRLAKSPWQPNARLGHGLALLKLNRPAEAIKQFDAVLATAAAGDELFQQAVRGKVQAALQMKDYAPSTARRRSSRSVSPAARSAATCGGCSPVAGRAQAVRPGRRLCWSRLIGDDPSPDAAFSGEGSRQDLENRYLLAVELRRTETLRRRPGRAAAGGRQRQRAS